MNELTKKLMCVQMRSGVEIWVEDGKAQRLQDALGMITQSKFIRFEDQTFNTADIVGVFEAKTMSDLTRRKNGEWQCQRGQWHGKGEKCECVALNTETQIKKREDAIKQCGKCQNGFILDIESNSARPCDCQKDVL